MGMIETILQYKPETHSCYFSTSLSFPRELDNRSKKSCVRSLKKQQIFQHCVQLFHLENPRKPGHRKILALFLVDPHKQIISTANVPCQQKYWWEELVRDIGPLGRVPKEINEHILGVKLPDPERCYGLARVLRSSRALHVTHRYQKRGNARTGSMLTMRISRWSLIFPSRSKKLKSSASNSWRRERNCMLPFNSRLSLSSLSQSLPPPLISMPIPSSILLLTSTTVSWTKTSI